MRLLVFGQHSDTGFGVVTKEISTRLVGLGMDVRIIAGNHRGEPIDGPLAGRVWPEKMLNDYFSNAGAAAINGALWKRFNRAADWTPDAVLCIYDMSGFQNQIRSAAEAEVFRSVPVYHYCPIEGDNLPPSWKGVWDTLAQPVAMSKYGQRVISEHIGRPVPMVYHGVDTEVFRPVKPGNPLIIDGKRISTKEAAKTHIKINPARKIVLRSDRLVERKFYHVFVKTMAEVMARDPDVVTLFHCSLVEPGEMLDLNEEVARLPDEMQSRFAQTNAHDGFTGLTREEYAVLLNAADVYVSTTGGEGFGLNLAEALACETPVVVTDWAAESEVCAEGSVLIPPLMDSYGDVVRHHSKYGMDWAVPDGRAFVEPILALLDRPARRRALGAAGRAHVIRNFSWDTAAAQFLALFEERNADRLAS